MQRSEPPRTASLSDPAPRPSARPLERSQPPAEDARAVSNRPAPDGRLPAESPAPESAASPPLTEPVSIPPSSYEQPLDAVVAIRAMRVIALKDDEAPPSVEASELSEDDIEEGLVPPTDALDGGIDVQFEADAETETETVEALDEADLTAEPERPPPPKRRQKSQPGDASQPSGSAFPKPPARPESSSDSARLGDDPTRSLGPTPTTRRRPWWETMFGDDFARAEKPPTASQVRRDVNFVTASLGLAPGSVVLDLCCGQGLLAAELASRGYAVVGYDLSVYQLAIAADNAQARQQKINFLQGDVREMAFEEMFDAVVCWDTSFGYFEEEKNHNVAERIFNALRPGGQLLLDVVNRDFAAVGSPNHVWFEGDGAICMDDMSLDWITSRLKVKRSLILDDGRSRECTYSVRLYTLHELGKLLHDVGFRVTQASGDVATPGVFFGPCSPRVIIRAQKP